MTPLTQNKKRTLEIFACFFLLLFLWDPVFTDHWKTREIRESFHATRNFYIIYGNIMYKYEDTKKVVVVEL